MNKHKILTTRRNGMDSLEQGAQILRCAEHDPLDRWGARTLKEKLALEGHHIPRCEQLAYTLYVKF